MTDEGLDELKRRIDSGDLPPWFPAFALPRVKAALEVSVQTGLDIWHVWSCLETGWRPEEIALAYRLATRERG